MFPFFSDPDHWIVLAGYWGVLGLVALESAAIPVPGEMALVSAALYAGAKHTLHLPGVIAAAAVGAVLGDSIGYWLGRQGGAWLLRRFGPTLHLDPRVLELGHRFSLRYGWKVVFAGRFFAIIRNWVAFLAGVNRMPWKTFFPSNVAGAAGWATLYGVAAYYLGDGAGRFARPLAISLVLAITVAMILGAVIVRRRGDRWIDAALGAASGARAGQG
ncbi:MAG TPA: DedA family protein [Myxococcaceae bacterium]